MSTTPDLTGAARQAALLALARRRATARRIPRRSPRTGPAPLSHAQRRIWLMDRLGQGGCLYNVPFATRVRGPLDLTALSDALSELVRRHEVLRTRYPHADGEPYQDITEPEPVALAVVEGGTEQVLQEARRPFDLATGPVLRALAVRHGIDDHTIVVTFHHIAVDGGSLGVIASELEALYGAGPAALPEPPPLQYADLAQWEVRREGDTDLEAGLAYWTRRLDGARPVPLPGVTAAPRSRLGRTHSAPLAVLDRLRLTAKEHGTTLFTVVLAGAFAALHQVTGEEDLVVGCASSLRDRAQTRALVGLCVNTLPVRVDLSGDPGFDALLIRVREALLEAQQHRHVPLDRIVERLGGAARDAGGNPLLAVTADLVSAPAALRLGGLDCEAVDIELGTAKFDVTFAVEEDEGAPAPRCLLQHDSAVLGESQGAELLHSFAEILTAVADDPALPLSELPGGRRAAAAAAREEGAGNAAAAAGGEPAAHAGTPDVERAAGVLAGFRELLGDRVGLDGDFFTAGGHSLLAVRLAERLRARLRLPVTGLDVMEHRTPRALTLALDRRQGARRAMAAPRRTAKTRAGTVLLTGGSGGVGAYVLRELAAQGRPVRALVRPESAHLVSGEGIEVVEGDLADRDSLRAAVAGVDAVIHSACTFTSPETDVAAMRELVDGWREGSQGAFVFVSSVDAYGRPTTSQVAEGAPTQEPLTAYGRGKVECEHTLLEGAGRERASVVRSPLVWAPHERFRAQLRWGATGLLYQAALAGEEIVLPDPADGEHTWYGAAWVHAAALARALVTCVDRPTGRVVNAVNGHVSWTEFTARLVQSLRSTSEVRLSSRAPADLWHPWRYEAEALAGELAEQPGEDWRSTLSAMV
ncbi:NAD(P)H-binding protein [Planomonospora sp. ID67723]|uniref:condensation domain-containing protein n=1 Tax=Planomonospora sp. ID67723 TaxID=2738134 RepID=UPI0018C37E4D|nr:condensation domain-containing protein [Planomonospora sp. ID67723]MBG0831419.1 NAD(P)H-binding protein [Planomonospora sp. ID67723]